MKNLILILLTTTITTWGVDVPPLDFVDGVEVRRAIPIEEARTYDATPAATPTPAPAPAPDNLRKDAAETVAGLFVLLVVLAVYLFPWIVAAVGRHHNTVAIGILNFLLGWTILGWIIALVWASTKPAPTKA